MSYKPARCPDCGENVQKCCCQAWSKDNSEIDRPKRELEEARKEIERLNQMLHQTSRSNAELIGEVIQEARKQAAREIIEDVIGEWNCDCGYGGLVIADAIKAKFKLEG